MGSIEYSCPCPGGPGYQQWSRQRQVRPGPVPPVSMQSRWTSTNKDGQVRVCFREGWSENKAEVLRALKTLGQADLDSRVLGPTLCFSLG